MLGNFMTREQVQDLAAKRAERRNFFRKSSGFAAGIAGGALVAACGGGGSSSVAQTAAPSDADILNFALNLEYLEAQFYIIAATGTRLAAGDQTGTGTQGPVTGGRQVTFADPVIDQYAREIARDEVAHVKFLRTTLGAAAVAQPAINISGGAGGPFAAAAVAAGIPSGASFDPYADDNSFLLGAFIFEDVGVTAYKGASPLIQNKTYLEAAAGILAAEAYHAGLVRTALYARGVATPSLRTSADSISNARDSLDNNQDVDQGISAIADPVYGNRSNIVPLDTNGIAFSRSPGDVLNIVFLNSGAVSSGGFFPSGVNGPLNLSSALA